MVRQSPVSRSFWCFRTSLLAAGSVVWLSCSDEPAGSAFGTVQGTVTVAGSDLPVRGANVRISDRWTETDAEGRFEVLDLEPGNLSLFARKDSYLNFGGTVSVVAGATATVQIPLIPFGAPLKPRGLFAGPHEQSGVIYLWWLPVDRAEDYTLYWSTTAGVTPATGTAIPHVESTYLHTNLIPGATYYYVLTSAGETGLGAPSPVAHATAGNGIQMGVAITNHPLSSPPEFVGDALPVWVETTSTLEIVEVTAMVEDRTVSLTFSPGFQAWSGEVTLDALPSPQLRQVTVTARDLNGTVAAASAPFMHDREAAAASVTSRR